MKDYYLPLEGDPFPERYLKVLQLGLILAIRYPLVLLPRILLMVAKMKSLD